MIRILILMLFVSCASASFRVDTLLIVDGPHKNCIGIVKGNDLAEQYYDLEIRCPEQEFSVVTKVKVPVEYTKVRTVKEIR